MGMPEHLSHQSGRALTPWWLWLLAVALLGTVIILQRPDTGPPTNQAALVDGTEKITAPETSDLILIGKIGLAIKSVTAGMPGAGTGGPNDPVHAFLSINDQMAGWMSDKTNVLVGPDNPAAKQKHPSAAVTRFRATIVGAQLGLDQDHLAWRLDDVEKDLAGASPLNDDLRVVRSILGVQSGPRGGPSTDESAAFEETPPAAKIPAPTQAEIDAFRGRHGWFADLAIAHGDKNAKIVSDAQSSGMLLLGVFVIAFAIIGCALIAGVVLLIIGAMAFASRRSGSFWRFKKPVAANEWPTPPDGQTDQGPWPALARPGQVWLETFVVFLAAFLGVKLVGSLIASFAGPNADWLGVMGVGLQWLVLPTIFWPIVRGMPFKRWCADVGWHRGEGTTKELACGLMGYLAFLPIYFGLAIVVVIIMFAYQAIMGEPQQAPSNKVLEIVQGGGVFELLMIYLLATIWAPVVEESIFRGALLRFFGGRTPMIIAALVTAAIFAALHGYLVMQLLLVGSLGFWFALLRQWRGSIIAPVLGHMIHNGFVLGLILIVTQFMKA
ncbi:MAG: CPBP family intramembrane metalloprotease [Phycisphaerales bacterium]|nr:CPBP family intramembrane metalloprotease [Phycisphaerales bacterium]